LASDELWIAQAGLPVELVTITPGGELDRHLLGQPHVVWDGSGFVAGTLEAPAPQVLVPAGHWQGARLAKVSGAAGAEGVDRDWSLVSCVVTPGFSFEDFELGERAALLAEYPQHEDLITALTLAG
jgi:predicted cupin superfamily sugar epimerase